MCMSVHGYECGNVNMYECVHVQVRMYVNECTAGVSVCAHAYVYISMALYVHTRLCV